MRNGPTLSWAGLSAGLLIHTHPEGKVRAFLTPKQRRETTEGNWKQWSPPWRSHIATGGGADWADCARWASSVDCPLTLLPPYSWFFFRFML